MAKQHPLQTLVQVQKSGCPAAICSICSASLLVIEAALRKAVSDGSIALIEATANQVNQEGGYTGLSPASFALSVRQLAQEVGLSPERLILGGDHLGPLTWREQSADQAMCQAYELVRQYTVAGFSKLHIDTSMHLGSDDPADNLSLPLIAKRTARLFQAAEEGFLQRRQHDDEQAERPVFIIGSEVPVPGGALDDESPQITSIADLAEELSCFRTACSEAGQDWAFQRICAIVVQPGIEFNDSRIWDYDRCMTSGLTAYMRTQPWVLEGHSTDYQCRKALAEMAEDGIAIQKVGPALTFALREGLLALEHIEHHLLSDADKERLSHFTHTLDQAMQRNPRYWQHYYQGSEQEQAFARLFSLSDRCRYYLGEQDVRWSVDRLLHNLSRQPLPLALISQYLPEQYHRIREGRLAPDPRELLLDRIIQTIEYYPAWQPH
jgi:D-tagatose-1,6-bisphosphate aldolase subunit GatZ/KbaZ